MTSFVSKLINSGKDEEAQEEEGRKQNAPWDSFRYRPASPRVARRAQLYDVIRASRKGAKLSRRRERAIHVITEKEAVRRVREWEAENGTAVLFLLNQQLITEDDLLSGIPMFEIADRLGLLTEVNDA